MNQLYKIALVVTVIVALALPGTALARSTYGDEVVFGGSYTLRSGETLEGNLFVFGGNATLDEGSLLNGDLILMGGNVAVSGEINGDVHAFGGNISLANTAVVSGDVNTVGGNVDRAPGARIEGEVSSGVRGPFPFVFPGVRVRGLEPFSPFRFFIDIVWFLFQTFLWAALAVLVIMFLPRQVERTSQAAVQSPLIAGGVGLLTAIVAPLLLIVLAITIILIPVSLIGILLLVVAWAFGMISLGYEVGKRLANVFNQVWAPAVAAGVGTFVLMFIANGIGKIACIGWIVPFLVGIVGLGATLLTRFGTAVYPPYAPEPPLPPRGDWPPVPPAPASTAAPRADQTSSPYTPMDVYPAPEEGEFPPSATDEYAPPAAGSEYPSQGVGVYPAPETEELPPARGEYPGEENRPPGP